MDFGLFFLMQRDEQWSEQAVYHSGLEQMLAAEALGYHSVWIAEHHFNDYGLCPAPPVLASFVAAGSTSEESVLSAARVGLTTLPSFFVPVPELQRRRRLYRAASLAAGRSLPEIEALEARSWGMRVVHVAPDHDEALHATEGPFMGYQRRMAVLRSDATGGSVPGSFDRSLLRLRAFREYLDDGWALIGTPGEVTRGLQQFCH